MDIEELKELQDSLVEIISLLIVADNEDEIRDMKSQAIEIIENKDFRKHINDEINGCTILDLVKQCNIGVGEKYTNKQGLKTIEEIIEKYKGKTSEGLGRVSSLNNGSESENELELENGSEPESESEDEDIVDHQARREYQTFQQNINSAKSCLVLSAISFIATTGILVGRTLDSIEHGKGLELMAPGVLFLGCLNFLSIGLIFDSNRIIRSNRDQINTLLENAADQQIIQQAQNR